MEKKKLNKKGFTMIELLAVIVIMSILALIATPAVYKYVTKSRGTSTDTMLKSTYEAAENYIMDNNITLNVGSTKTIQVSELVNEQYLERLTDPVSNSKLCSNRTGSKVVVKRLPNTTGGMINYQYDITIDCPESGIKMYTYPSDGILETTYDGVKKYVKDNQSTFDGLAEGAEQTVTANTLFSSNYIKEIKDTDGVTVCHTDAASKVVIKKQGSALKYTVTIKCGSNTYTGTYKQ